MAIIVCTHISTCLEVVEVIVSMNETNSEKEEVEEKEEEGPMLSHN